MANLIVKTTLLLLMFNLIASDVIHSIQIFDMCNHVNLYADGTIHIIMFVVLIFILLCKGDSCVSVPPHNNVKIDLICTNFSFLFYFLGMMSVSHRFDHFVNKQSFLIQSVSMSPMRFSILLNNPFN